MEDMIIKKQPPSPLAMHKDSQRISKIKPKIRIIHIFAPEIIKTDVANFRELVQRLTGKPSDHHHHQKGSHFKNKKPRTVSNQEQENLQPKPSITSNNKKMELVTTGFMNNYNNKVIKEEEEDPMWNGANSGGFLAGFADLDGFIQELNEEFPMLPMEVINNHHMQYGFGERQLV
ncbi:hypothetical protein JCGZ_25538 [Jatropha curcas]|uniref:VQ domain-containing protein n=1 Tax=Jatropha curcas TaxID=180498 RepID=A0A067JL42_JATCU|nr:VQ motif-containing protein 17 [Jatropha curcas]KDP24622.1 hypothetical protein JCGZ_25538 [Jatropha curcas]